MTAGTLTLTGFLLARHASGARTISVRQAATPMPLISLQSSVVFTHAVSGRRS